MLLVLILHTNHHVWCPCQDDHPNEDATIQKISNSSREYYTLISLISQTIFKQLQMQPFKHPCIVWGIHLPDIVLPWQKSSCQNIPFIHKLQFSFEERHYFFIKKYYPYKIYSSPLNMQRSFLRNVVFLSLIVRCSLPSIIQYVFQNIRFLHNMQCVIDIFYCCQKRCNDQCTLKTPWKKNCFIFLQIRNNSLAKKIYFVKTMQYIL